MDTILWLVSILWSEIGIKHVGIIYYKHADMYPFVILILNQERWAILVHQGV